MADAAVSFAVERLGDALINKVNFLIGVKDQVRWMKDELQSMQCFLKDAAEKQGNKEYGHLISQWIRDVREVAQDAEDTIEIFALRVDAPRKMRNRVRRWACFLCHLNRVGNEIGSIKTRLAEIAQRRNYDLRNLGVVGTESSGSRSEIANLRRRMETLYKNDEDVVGLNKDADLLVNEVILDDKKKGLSVAAIVGIGGIGKSTLARKIFKHPRIAQQFDKCAFVVVSSEFVLEDVMKLIMSELSDPLNADELNAVKSIESRVSRQGKLLEMLRKRLQGKRYFIVLDDVWETIHWDALEYAFPDDQAFPAPSLRRFNLRFKYLEHLVLNRSEAQKSWSRLSGSIARKTSGLSVLPRHLLEGVRHAIPVRADFSDYPIPEDFDATAFETVNPSLARRQGVVPAGRGAPLQGSGRGATAQGAAGRGATTPLSRSIPSTTPTSTGSGQKRPQGRGAGSEASDRPAKRSQTAPTSQTAVIPTTGSTPAPGQSSQRPEDVAGKARDDRDNSFLGWDLEKAQSPDVETFDDLNLPAHIKNAFRDTLRSWTTSLESSLPTMTPMDGLRMANAMMSQAHVMGSHFTNSMSAHQQKLVDQWKDVTKQRNSAVKQASAAVKKAEDAAAAVAPLEQKVETLSQQVDTLRGKVEKVEGEKAALEQSAKQADGAIRAQDELIDGLRKERDELQNLVDEQKAKLAQAEAEQNAAVDAESTYSYSVGLVEAIRELTALNPNLDVSVLVDKVADALTTPTPLSIPIKDVTDRYNIPIPEGILVHDPPVAVPVLEDPQAAEGEVEATGADEGDGATVDDEVHVE